MRRHPNPSHRAAAETEGSRACTHTLPGNRHNRLKRLAAENGDYSQRLSRDVFGARHGEVVRRTVTPPLDQSMRGRQSCRG